MSELAPDPASINVGKALVEMARHELEAPLRPIRIISKMSKTLDSILS